MSFLAATMMSAVFLSCFILVASPPGPIWFRAAYFVLLLTATIPVAAGHALILGVPAYLLGTRFQTISMWSCAIVGFMIGALPMGIAAWRNQPEFGWSDFVPGGLSGAVGGVVFWALWHFWIPKDANGNSQVDIPLQ